MKQGPFTEGDEVRLKSGKSPIRVLEVRYFPRGTRREYVKKEWGQSARNGWFIRYVYYSSVHHDLEGKWREAEDFTFYDEDTPVHKLEKEEPIMTKPSLYQTIEKKPRYGTFLIKNSEGQMVLEMKGENGAVESFDEAHLEIVTPHTVELTLIGMDPGGTKSKSIHVIAQKGQAAKDDVFLEMHTGCIWRVTVTDSKCLSPRENKSKWMKIPAAFVTFGEQ